MKLVQGQVTVITGAAGGLGSCLARAFALKKHKLVLVDCNPQSLSALVGSLDTEVLPLVADLRLSAERERVLRESLSAFGHVDLLINNAGVEYTQFLHRLSGRQIEDAITVNLTAPIHLVNLALSGMLERRQGHFIHLSSLALLGNSCQDVYSSTKAGLSAFNLCIRSTYRGSGVSSSSIIPGFIDTGIYQKLNRESGLSAPVQVGVVPPRRVIDAVFRAVQGDKPELVVNRFPIRWILAARWLSPRLGEFLLEATGSNRFFKQVAEAQWKVQRPS